MCVLSGVTPVVASALPESCCQGYNCGRGACEKSCVVRLAKEGGLITSLPILIGRVCSLVDSRSAACGTPPS